MSPAHRAAAIVAAALFVIMLVLLLRGPHIRTSGYGDPVVRVECSSVLAVGWPSDHTTLQDEERFDHWSDHVVGDVGLTEPQRIGIALDCAERRTTYLGILVLLAVPTALLGAAALRR